jgi:hypothetical protein
LETAIPNAKEEVAALLARLPDDTSLEDVQYHLYVVEKIRRGVERAEIAGTFTQAEAETRLGKWLNTP